MYGVWKALSGPAFKILYSSLLYLSAAAAEKMKEAEVDKNNNNKSWGWARDRGGKGRGPFRLGKDSSVCHPCGAPSKNSDFYLPYLSICTQERLSRVLKGEKSSKHDGKDGFPITNIAERSWECGWTPRLASHM